MNAERILIAAECIGDARWFIAKATAYAATASSSAGRSAQNQGVQFPIARAFATAEAAALMAARGRAPVRRRAACGAEANMAKLLAADASWQAAEGASRPTAASASPTEYDVERKFRETRLYQVAPISTNLILAYLAEHVSVCHARTDWRHTPGTTLPFAGLIGYVSFSSFTLHQPNASAAAIHGRLREPPTR